MVDRSLTLGTLFSANVGDFIRKVDLIKKKVGQLNATMASVGKQSRGLDKTTGSIDKMGKSMDKTGRAGKGFTSQLGFMGKALGSVSAAAKTTAAFFAAGLAISTLTKGLAAGTREIIDFDQALKNLQAITKSTDAEVIGMGEVIKKVATETKFSTGEVAEGMVLLGQAGFSVQEAMQAMASVANLATGTLSDMRMTSDLLTTTIRAFNLSTVESARVADVMANAINRSKLTIDKLRIAFNFVGAASSQAGLSIEETAGSMMLLANNGLRASTIGTGLRQVMARLLAPNRRLREEFKEQGIALERVNPATQGWSNALENLVPLLINTETGLINMGKAYKLFGLRGAQAVAILAKGVASGDYEKMIEFTQEVGSAARMAATQMEGLGVKIKNLADRMKLIAVALGDAGLTDAFKVLIDTLRATAKAVTNFINSEGGQLITAFAGWAIVIGVFTKGIRLLGVAVRFLLRPFMSLFAVLTATKVATGAAGVKLGWLLSKVRLLIKGVGVLGVVFGAVTAVVMRLVGSIQTEIDALEKVDTKTQTVIQTLSLYAAKLEELIEKKEEDEDVTKAHSKTIERLQQAIKELEKGYDELDIALDDNTDSLEANLAAVEKLKKAELEKSVQANIDLVKNYTKQIERQQYWLVVWQRVINSTIGWLKDLGTEIRAAIKAVKEFGSKAVDYLAKKLESLEGIGQSISDVFTFIVDDFVGLWNNIQARVDAIAASYKGNSEKIISLTDAQRDAFVRAARGLDLLGRGARSIKDIVDELETLSGKKIDVKGLDLINDALKKTSFSLDENKKKWNETFNDLPTVFKDMYDKMDVYRSINLDKALKAMGTEEAAMETQAEVMGRSAGEVMAARAIIRAKHMQKMEEEAKKEVKINKDTIDSMVANYDYFVEQTNKSYHKRTANAVNHYLQEYDLANKSKKQLAKLETQYSEEVNTITKEREEALMALGESRNRFFVDVEKQTVRDITKLNEKMYKDLSSQLKKRLKDAKKGLKDLEDDLLDVQKDRREQLREINQLVMTDEAKWLDDRKEVHVLFNKALSTGDEDYYKKAIDLAAGLARRVNDEQGEMVRSVADTQVEAKDLMIRLFEAQEDSLRVSISKQKKTIKDFEQSLVNVNQKFVDMKAKIDKINSTELILLMDDSLADMREMHNITSDFKKDWDLLKSKTITLTVKYKHVGASPPKEKSTQEGNTVDSERVDTQRWGGIIRRRLGGAIRKALDVGGKLAGYGGGDKVKAALEPGEYVIRKEAVKKYGEGVFSSLNNMRVASKDIGNTVANQIGGLIKRASQNVPVQKFAAGGDVGLTAVAGAPRTVNIYLQPKYMTGDRQAMRAVAADLSRVLDEQNRRWGRR